MVFFISRVNSFVVISSLIDNLFDFELKYWFVLATALATFEELKVEVTGAAKLSLMKNWQQLWKISAVGK
jgi:hypothetical protein